MGRGRLACTAAAPPAAESAVRACGGLQRRARRHRRVARLIPYRHRWGDAIIRRLELALMGSKVLHLDELAPHSKYCHRNLCMPGFDKDTSPSGKVRHFELAVVG